MHIHNSPLKGIGVRDFYRGSFMLCLFLAVFTVFFNTFLIFEFILRQLFLIPAPAILVLTRRIDPRTPEPPIP